MNIKNDANENANKIIYKKLDIINYIRNMILFDIMSQTILDDERNDIINFLCHPIITNQKIQSNEFNEFYRNYKEEDFYKFLNNIKQLLNKSQKTEKENKLITLSKEHLKASIK